MKILALDTATESCSAALWLDSDIYERYEVVPRRHATLILPMINELLTAAGLHPAQLDAVAFGRGPGSFTGIRIACGVVQGIAFAADIPVVPVSTLATLAQAAAQQGHTQVIAAIDARMSEIYCGFYTCTATGLVSLSGIEQVCPPAAIQLPEDAKAVFGTGSGWATYADVLKTGLANRLAGYDGEQFPRASAMLPLAVDSFGRGQVVSAAEALPVYLRDQVVQTS